jgi:hypothetical protein
MAAVGATVVAEDHEHQKAYVCIHVFDGSAPVLLVSRPDGDWCFLCGAIHDDVGSQYRVVGMSHLIEVDKSLSETLDLESDWEAERSNVGERWLRTKVEPEH